MVAVTIPPTIGAAIRLYAILISSLVPRIEEKIRISLLARMKQQMQQNASLPEIMKESI